MNEKISTAELATLLAEHAHISIQSATDFIRAAFPLVGKILQEKKYLKINGLGTFKLITVSSRESVDINSGKRILIGSYDKITFTPDVALKEKVNKPFQHFEAVELRDDIDFAAIDEELEAVFPDEEVSGLPGDEEVSTPAPRPEEEKSIGFPQKTEALSEKEARETDESPDGGERDQSSGQSPQAAQADRSFAEKTGIPATPLEPGQQETPVIPQKNVPESVVPSSIPVSPSPDADRRKQEEADAMGSLALKTKKDYEKEDPAKRFSFVISVKHCFVLSLLIIVFLAYICIWKPAWFFGYYYPVPETPAVLSSTITPQTEQPQANVPSPVQDEQISVQDIGDKGDGEQVWIAIGRADPRDYMAVGILDSVLIRPGNSLTKLSKKYYGTMDLWPHIASYNQGVLHDPDNLPIGATLIIPRLAKK